VNFTGKVKLTYVWIEAE